MSKAKLISSGRALPVSFLLLHAQLKGQCLSSCLKHGREAKNKKKIRAIQKRIAVILLPLTKGALKNKTAAD